MEGEGRREEEWGKNVYRSLNLVMDMFSLHYLLEVIFVGQLDV